MARIANKYLPIQQLDPQNPHLFLAQIIGAKDFRRDVLLRIIYDPQEWEEALNIAKKCAHLHHSNVLQTLDVGQHNDFWYVAYEFIESLTLTEILHKKISLSVEHVVYICTEILIALSYARTQHTEPIHHLNLTPDQILLTKQGSIKIRGFGLRCSLPADSPYRNPTPMNNIEQDLYGVGKILEKLCGLISSAPIDLIRIAEQATTSQSNVQFQSLKAMYDILLHRFPLSGTTSVDLAQNIVQQSFEQWEEQPTFISKTFTTKDTQIFMAPDIFAADAPLTEAPPTLELPAPPTQAIEDPSLYWFLGAIVIVLFSLGIGFLLGTMQLPDDSFKAMVPKGLSIRANGKPFSEISHQALDTEMTLEVLQNDTVLNTTKVQIEPHQHLIIILPLEATSANPAP